MQKEIKFPLVMEDGNKISSKEELMRYLKIKKYIDKELRRDGNLTSGSGLGSGYGGYGIDLI
ncbi:hypothetical protein [uncultured Clostridium sp.]|uniref:hypothetical protein n=1 Tax=uncultured Clostridium sp. TaxID=59620 RepID=UPI0025F7C0D4|nr:hypothetical protein [uncultured Clostridium sp.]